MEDVNKVVAQWRKEMPDLPLAGMEFFGHLFRAAQLGARAVGVTHARHRLKPGEFDVLSSLRRSGKPYRLTPTRLFQGLMLSSGAMTNRLDKLEQAGLIARAPDPDDRRGTLISLTSRGQALVEKVVREHAENEEKLAAVLTAAERKQLTALLTKLSAGLAEHAAGEAAE